ncbi:MAG: S9 family peptidase [Sphingobacteriaceae bacterium]|nr:S9 family peptidase [Sphingobacteriaceae bacterium]
MSAKFVSILLLNFSLANAFGQNTVTYPKSVEEKVSDNYFGTKIEDPYRWLEDDRSKATEDWVKAQNVVTEKFLEQQKGRATIKKRLTELWNFSKQSAPYKKGNHFFCTKNNGLQNQNVLYIKKTMEDEGEILLDPNELSKDGTISLNGTSVSKDGKYLAYGISKAGSDWVEIHFKEIATKKELPEIIKWVKFSGMSWKGDGIYYSRYDEPDGSVMSQKNQFHKVYYHKVGTDQTTDLLIHEDKEHPNYNFSVDVSDDEKYITLYTSESTSGHMIAVKEANQENAKFVVIENDFNSEGRIVDNIGKVFYMRTNHGSPNYKLVTFTLDTPDFDQWNTIIPESKHLLEGVHFCNHKILVNYLENVTSKLYCYSIEGNLEKEIPLDGVCRLTDFHSSKNDEFATYGTVKFTSPEQIYLLDAKRWSSKMIFNPDIKFDSGNYTTEQVFFESKDGTKIPMFITSKKGLIKDENTPCFVFGYGGFNISLAPEFRIDRAVFIEAGGIYCVPNLRGGGEFGEEWHKSGTKCNKQNVFDDFIAACDYLVKNKYTSYQKLAIHGRSNGGLLIGAVMTQRPDICNTAIPTVGVLDMLRFHQFTIGSAWTVDYGCSENKSEFECLIKYSPLHNIKKVKYPATLILTGDHDDRVVPAHSFKFAATMQNKNTSTNPILIRIDVNAGHGSGKPTNKQIDEFTDMWTFVFNNLKMKI